MSLRTLIITALFAALIVGGSYIAFPLGPVPLTLQTLFVLLAGVLGGGRVGFSAVAIYLVLGALGLPVFYGGSGGVAHFFSPTGGFLLSLLVAAPIAGAITDLGFRSERKRTQLLFTILGAAAGTIVIFLIGIPFLKLFLKVAWREALLIGLLPFIVGDLIKLVVVVLLGNIFALRIRMFIKSGGDEDDSGD
ncbi:MAG: biotin transporter BioY [Spirochaetales bacterium]|jgi:biotin transport system substrate-specific component|nr:biotin transporter BioY [Spirochaetales bacterium]